jgi:hypothetical protein
METLHRSPKLLSDTNASDLQRFYRVKVQWKTLGQDLDTGAAINHSQI